MEMKRIYSTPETKVYEVDMELHLSMSYGEIETNPGGDNTDSASRMDFSSGNNSNSIWDSNW